MPHYPYVLAGRQWVFHHQPQPEAVGIDRIEIDGSGITTTMPRATNAWLPEFAEVAVGAVGDGPIILFNQRRMGEMPSAPIAATQPNANGFASNMTWSSALSYSSPAADHDIVFGLTSDGRIEASRLSADLRFTPVASLPRPYSPVSVLRAFTVGGQPHLVFESRHLDSFAEVLRLDGNVLTPVVRWSLAGDWLMAPPFLVGGAFHVLESVDGHACIRVVGPSMTTRWTSSEPTRWGDSFVVFTRGDYGYLLESRSGHITIYRLDPGGSGIEKVWAKAGNWSITSQLEPVILNLDGRTFLAAYSPEFDPLGLDYIDPIGGGIVATWRPGRQLDVDWKAMGKQIAIDYIVLLAREARLKPTAGRVIEHLVLWSQLASWYGQTREINGNFAGQIVAAARRDYGLELSPEIFSDFVAQYLSPPGGGPAIARFLINERARIVDMTAEQIAARAAQSGYQFTADEYRAYLAPFAAVALLFRRLRDNNAISEQSYEATMGSSVEEPPPGDLSAAGQLALGARLFAKFVITNPGAGELFSVMQYPLAAVSETWAQMVLGGIEGQSYSFADVGDMLRDNYSAALQASADGLENFHSNF